MHNNDVQFVRKSADQEVVNNAAMVDDAELSFQIGAGQTHAFKFGLVAFGHETSDIRCGVVAPEGAQGVYCVSGPRVTAIPSNAVMSVHINPDNQFSNPLGYSRGLYQNPATLAYIEIEGHVRADVAGAVRLQFGQAVAGPNPTVLKAESFVRAERVA